MYIALVVAAVEITGILTAAHAVMHTRTSQGAIAWSVSLITFPWVAVPLYWVFGRRRFAGYQEAFREHEQQFGAILRQARANLASTRVDPPERMPNYEALRALARIPLTRANHVDLLVDGEATFDSILSGIDEAKDYVLVQFYIVRGDDLGQRLRAKLLEKIREGVRVYFVYDEIGSLGLPAAYAAGIRAAGGHVSAFRTTRGRRNRFQLNFRNHRKIVVVDGRTAWVGGLNVGDEYLGLERKMSPWRDTHVRVDGPAALGAQAAFLVDWCWATGDVLELDWKPDLAEGHDEQAVMLATGPADMHERAKLFFMHALNAARDRIWIASPYFVPDPAVSASLELAALRGVDVRVLTPKKNDSLMVQLTSYASIQELEGTKIRFAQHRPGFMHQKVMLIDDRLAVVGTHNFDNRSFLLNFEISAIVHDEAFAKQVEDMLEADFRSADPLDPADLGKKPFWFRLAVQTARLFAPIM